MENQFIYTEKGIFLKDYEINGKYFKKYEVVELDIDFYHELIDKDVISAFNEEQNEKKAYKQYYFAAIVISLIFILLLSALAFLLIDILVISISLGIMFGFNIIYSIFKIKEWHGY